MKSFKFNPKNQASNLKMIPIKTRQVKRRRSSSNHYLLSTLILLLAGIFSKAILMNARSASKEMEVFHTTKLSVVRSRHSLKASSTRMASWPLTWAQRTPSTWNNCYKIFMIWQCVSITTKFTVQDSCAMHVITAKATPKKLLNASIRTGRTTQAVSVRPATTGSTT